MNNNQMNRYCSILKLAYSLLRIVCNKTTIVMPIFLIFFYCAQNPLKMSNDDLVNVQAQIAWFEGTVVVTPDSVAFVRLTAQSSCAGTYSSTFPFAAGSGRLQVKSGCSFTLLCEGLGSSGQVIYRGEVRDVKAEGDYVNVRLTASLCTPEAPDSLRAVPSGRKIQLLWRDRSNNERGFIIKRAMGSDIRFTVLDTVPSQPYIDDHLILRGVLYRYLVYSYNENGLSVFADTLDGFSLGSNSTPEFISTPSDMDSTAEVDSVYCDTIHYQDVNVGDSLLLVLDTFPSGLVIHDSIITWKPLVSQEGKSFLVRAIVSDQDSTRDSLLWKIKVKDTVLINHPPVFSSTTLEMYAAVALHLQYRDTVKAIDPDLGAVIYTKITMPATASIDSLSGIVSWQTDILGNNQFTVVARDRQNGYDTLSWNVLVFDSLATK